MASKSWRSTLPSSLGVSLAPLSGCAAPVGSQTVARAFGASPTIRSDGPLRGATGEPTIEETVDAKGNASYRVRIPLAPQSPAPRSGGKPPESELRAMLHGNGSGSGAVQIACVGVGKESALEINFSHLPPRFESAQLRIENSDESGGYRLEGLKTSTERPRLASMTMTTVGAIEAIGLREYGVGRGSGISFGGIALRLPWRPGFVRRLRNVAIQPAYGDLGGSHFGMYADGNRLPAVISNEGYGYLRWEARGHLDLLSVFAQGDASRESSPVEVAQVQPGKRWRISAKGTIPDGQDIQIRVNGGRWIGIYDGTYTEEQPRAVLYRQLRQVQSVPFAVQADAFNESGQKVTSHSAGISSIVFDYGAVLDHQTKQGQAVSIIR